VSGEALPAARWNIIASGKSMRCLNASDWAEGDGFARVIPQLGADPLTRHACIFECGAGLKKIEIWHNEKGERIWIDNVIGV